MILNPEQIALLEWLVTPKAERKYETQQELAEALGVNEVTVSRWKRLPEFKEALTAATMEWAESKLPQVMNSLVSYALLPGGTKDRETIAKYVQPAIIKARADRFFDILLPHVSKTNKVSQEMALELLEELPIEQQQKFMEIFATMGAIAGASQLESDTADRRIEVRKREEDIIDVVPLLPPGPGRPRGSRKVRLKHRGED